jgi:glycogen operon protein
MNDLVSYNTKHNEANGEGNRDGADDNRSWNCGTEGPTTDADIVELRARQRRNFLVTLFLSQGVPMLLAGDEMGHTQLGNNNAYCQDNEVSWLDWGLAETERDLLQFTQTLADLRRYHPVFRRRRFFRGHPQATGGETGDLVWLTPTGQEMTQDDWAASDAKSLGVFLNGEAISEPDPRGEKITDAKFLLLFNAHSHSRTFTLPDARLAAGWQVVIDTALRDTAAALTPKSELEVSGRAVIVLRSTD